MRMILVTYRKTFNLGSYQSESIGVEMELNEGDSAVVALDNCAALVDEYHVKTLATLDAYRGTHTEIIPEENTIDQTIAATIQEISRVTVIDHKNGFGVQVGLLAYTEKALLYPQVQEAYDNKLKELEK